MKHHRLSRKILTPSSPFPSRAAAAAPVPAMGVRFRPDRARPHSPATVGR